MYKFLIILIAITSVFLFVIEPRRSIRQSQRQHISDCNNMESIRHVYRPWRLIVHKKCIRVTGVVTKVKEEKDGDAHIQVKVDKPFRNTLNFGNMLVLHGDLLLEPVCVHKPRYNFEKKTCKNYTSSAYIPKVGQHITVTGQYVTDVIHFVREIHPVYEIH